MAVSRTRLRLLSATGAALLAVGVLAGCAARGDSSSGAAPEQANASYSDAQSQADQMAGASPLEDRALVTSGSMGITSDDVAAATATAEDIVARLGGRIDSRSEQTGGRASTTLRLRVPADDYDTLVEELRSVGDVSYVETQVLDVTMETVDLDARIASLESSVASLRQMLAQSTNVSDMLEVEATLSEREAELQSLKAQQTALADQVAMSTLDLRISNDELSNPTPRDDGGFLSGLQAGWNTLVAVFNGALTVFGFLLPGLIVLAVLGLIAFAIVRAALAARRKNARVPAPAGVGTAAPGAGTAPGTSHDAHEPRGATEHLDATDAPNAPGPHTPAPYGAVGTDAPEQGPSDPTGAVPDQDPPARP